MATTDGPPPPLTSPRRAAPLRGSVAPARHASFRRTASSKTLVDRGADVGPRAPASPNHVSFHDLTKQTLVFINPHKDWDGLKELGRN